MLVAVLLDGKKRQDLGLAELIAVVGLANLVEELMNAIPSPLMALLNAHSDSSQIPLTVDDLSNLSQDPKLPFTHAPGVYLHVFCHKDGTKDVYVGSGASFQAHRVQNGFARRMGTHNKPSEEYRTSSLHYQKWNRAEDEDFWVIYATFDEHVAPLGSNVMLTRCRLLELLFIIIFKSLPFAITSLYTDPTLNHTFPHFKAGGTNLSDPLLEYVGRTVMPLLWASGDPEIQER